MAIACHAFDTIAAILEIYKVSWKVLEMSWHLLLKMGGHPEAVISQRLIHDITQKMADQGRFDLDVVFTMILCTTDFYI